MNLHISQRMSNIWVLGSAILGGLVIACMVTLAVFSQTTEVSSHQIPAPTIVKPGSADRVIMKDKNLTIAGLTKNKTEVEVFVDGKSIGGAKTVDHPSGTASFAIRVADKKLSAGEHRVWAHAKEREGKRVSEISNIITFAVEYPYPAPILKQPIVNASTVYTRPWIVGVARSGDEVEISLDGATVARVQAGVHSSGSGSFKWLPPGDLKEGWHSVRVRSRAHRGTKESMWSEAFVFSVLERTGTPKSIAHVQVKYSEESPRSIPAPTIITPVPNAVIEAKSATIAGVVRNGMKVQIFINERMVDELSPREHASGVTSFSYAFKGVPVGDVSFRARAVDAEGTYSSFSKEVPVFIKPHAKQIVQVTKNGVFVWPRSTVAQIGGGIKVVRATSTEENTIARAGTEETGEAQDESRNESAGEGVSMSEESSSTLPELKERTVAQGRTEMFTVPAAGATPEISGPVFDTNTSLDDIEILMGEVASATATPSSSISVAASSDKGMVEQSEGAVQDDMEKEYVQNQERIVRGYVEEVAASAKKTSERPYRPEALVLIAAGIIILIGIVITVIRDRMQARAGTVDFSNPQATISLENDQRKKPYGMTSMSIPPPPPPPAI